MRSTFKCCECDVQVVSNKLPPKWIREYSNKSGEDYCLYLCPKCAKELKEDEAV